MDDRLALETPEQIEIQYEIARLGSRFIATLVDTAAIFSLQLMLVVVAYVAMRFVERFGDAAVSWGIAITVLAGFILYWGYYVLFELLWNGQTPGKRLAAIRTVQHSGYPIGFTESAIRNIVRVADLMPGIYGVGMLVMFADRRSRRLGDFVAGTLVVHDRPPRSLELLSTRATQDERLLEIPVPHLDRLQSAEIEAARRFLQRREGLTNADALAADLARRFRARLGLEEPEDATPEADLRFLRRVVAQAGRYRTIFGS